MYVVRHDAAGIVLYDEEKLSWDVFASEYEAVPTKQRRL